MPKNTKGGKGHKKLASKGSGVVQRDYKITSSLEVEGYVEKILGNGMIRVNSSDGRHVGLICAIRGKFKGRNKTNNSIEVNGIIVVGLREWETPHKTADLLYVYSKRYKAETDECGNDYGVDFKTTGHNDLVFENLNTSAENKLIMDNNATEEIDDVGNAEINDIDIDDI